MPLSIQTIVHIYFFSRIFLSDLEITIACDTFKIDIKRMLIYVIIILLFMQGKIKIII